MAARPINGDTDIDLTLKLIDRSLGERVNPLVERIANLERAVEKLSAEVHDSNSRTTTRPEFDRAFVVPMNRWTALVAVVVAIAVILGLTGQGDKIPQVVGSHLPGAVPSGE